MNPARTFRGITRRSMHVISSASAKSAPTTAASRQQKLPQNGFAALAAQEQAPQLSSARDIEELLSNIGAGCRASRMTIESMMQSSGTPTKAEHQPCKLSGSEIIDLIAQIRSM